MQYIYSAPEIYRTGQAFIDATRWYWQNEDLYKLGIVSGGGKIKKDNKDDINKGYNTPAGGGGATDCIRVNNIIVYFGHGGRHLEGSGLSISEVNTIIANEISKIHPGTGQFYKGQVTVNGLIVEYTSYGIRKGVINVGTYYPIQ